MTRGTVDLGPGLLRREFARGWRDTGPAAAVIVVFGAAWAALDWILNGDTAR